MDKAEIQSVSFQLVSHVGEASGCFFEAMEQARGGRFDEAVAQMELGKKALIEAHKTQTDLLRSEVKGEDVAFSLLLVHAQDHLMTTILLERMAHEFINVYREVHHEV